MSQIEKRFRLYCSSSLGTDEPPLSGADLLMDAWHREHVGAELLAEAGRVHASREQWEFIDDTARMVVVVDTRPAVWISAINKAFRSGDSGREVFIITTQEHLTVIGTIAGGWLCEDLEVHVVAMRQQLSVTGLRVRGNECWPLQPLMVGLRVGGEPQVRDQEERLLAAAASAARAGDGAATTAQQLEARNAALEEDLRVLQQRHTNLSNSTLGRFTTKYWALRNRLKR